MITTYVGQGEHAVSGDPSAVFQTLLGSCVSTCLHDPVLNIGGLNHMVLSNTAIGADLFTAASQVNDMERLINALLKRGAVRERLTAKVFGGAQMTESSTTIGLKNARFVLNFLSQEGVRCIGQSVGGKRARRLKFWPASGRVLHKYVHDTSPKTEMPASPKRESGQVELF